MELSSSYECVPRGLWFGEGRGSGCSCGQAGFYRSCLVFCLIFCRIFLPFGWQSFLGDETAASSMISSLVPPWPHLFGHPSAGNHHSPYIVRHGGVPPAAEGRRSGLRGPCKCWSGKLGRLCSRLGSVLSFLASWKSRKKIEFQMLLRYLWGFFFWFWNKELARIHRLTLCDFRSSPRRRLITWGGAEGSSGRGSSRRSTPAAPPRPSNRSRRATPTTSSSPGERSSISPAVSSPGRNEEIRRRISLSLQIREDFSNNVQIPLPICSPKMEKSPPTLPLPSSSPSSSFGASVPLFVEIPLFPPLFFWSCSCLFLTYSRGRGFSTKVRVHVSWALFIGPVGFSQKGWAHITCRMSRAIRVGKGMREEEEGGGGGIGPTRRSKSVRIRGEFISRCTPRPLGQDRGRAPSAAEDGGDRRRCGEFGRFDIW